MPQRSISYTQNRLAGRCHCQPSSDELFGCLLRLSSNTFGLGRDCFCYPYRELSLQSDAIRFEECRIHIPKNDDKDVRVAIGENIEIYIDDMVVKSKMVSEHLGDLQAIFQILRKYKLRLNVSKCSLGVGSSKFLGYMVTHRGIEVIPNQIKAINNLRSPRNPKDVQKLTGMATALNRFISRSANRCRPFFLLINKWKSFEWTKECATAF